jgi:nucleotide-binding universal stress UspA family protein
MKLLVTTDFSSNSKAAIRFARNLAGDVKKTEVIFFHAIEILKPLEWSDEFFNEYKNEEITRLGEELKKFVQSVTGKNKNPFAKVDYVVENCLSIEDGIVKYAQKNSVDAICIATRGGGMLRKIIGSRSSYIVHRSPVPVLVIPAHYRTRPLKKITYLSDFENLPQELDSIFQFFPKVKFELEILHYASITFNQENLDAVERLLHSGKWKNVRVNVQKTDLQLSLIERVKKYVRNSRPDLLVMFTKKEKGFFEKIFLPSKSAELTYSTKLPLLIFSK